jgi:hypothetical protein
MARLEDFFATTFEEVVALLLYQAVFFFAFYGSYRPIWAQNELAKLSVDRKKQTVRRTTVHYGWQTRKRNEWNTRQYARWVVMNPEYFYNGLLWTFFYMSGAYGAYYLLTGTDQGDLRTVALALTTGQVFIIGSWSIPGFYWDLPGWSIFLLGASSAFSVAVCILYGLLEEYSAMGFFAFYTLGQIALFLIYGISYAISIQRGQWPKHSRRLVEARERGGHHPRPLGLLASFWKYGLYPASYWDRDLPWIVDGVYRKDVPLHR